MRLDFRGECQSRRLSNGLVRVGERTYIYAKATTKFEWQLNILA